MVRIRQGEFEAWLQAFSQFSKSGVSNSYASSVWGAAIDTCVCCACLSQEAGIVCRCKSFDCHVYIVLDCSVLGNCMADREARQSRKKFMEVVFRCSTTPAYWNEGGPSHRHRVSGGNVFIAWRDSCCLLVDCSIQMLDLYGRMSSGRTEVKAILLSGCLALVRQVCLQPMLRRTLSARWTMQAPSHSTATAVWHELGSIRQQPWRVAPIRCRLSGPLWSCGASGFPDRSPLFPGGGTVVSRCGAWGTGFATLNSSPPSHPLCCLRFPSLVKWRKQ